MGSPSAGGGGGWAARGPLGLRALIRVQEGSGGGGAGQLSHRRHRFVPFTVAFWWVPVLGIRTKFTLREEI